MSETRPVISARNPSTGEYDYQFEAHFAHDVGRAAKELRLAQGGWCARGFAHRGGVLARWAAAIRKRRDELIASLVADTGRRHESELELEAVLAILERWSQYDPAEIIAPPRPSATRHVRVEQKAVPYALVGVISPWNGPLLLALIDAIPALLAGSAVLIKPSEITPRLVEPLLQSIQDVAELQAVISIVRGKEETGRALIDQVDAICFTGSTRTGHIVAQQAASRMIPAYLELGGKDPAIILPDADLRYAAAAIFWGSVTNAGQACQSIERVYVHRRDHDQLLELLCQLAAETTLSFEDERSGIGPIISASQVEVIARHLDDAVRRGAKILAGGIVEKGGAIWVRPTILSSVDHTMLVMTEETFGPIIPVMSYNDIGEAIALANDTSFGLSAAVFGSDEQAAIEVAEFVEAGAISVNDAALTAIVSDAEKMAFKTSGLGASRMGNAAIRRFLRPKAILVNEAASTKECPSGLLGSNRVTRD